MIYGSITTNNAKLTASVWAVLYKLTCSCVCVCVCVCFPFKPLVTYNIRYMKDNIHYSCSYLTMFIAKLCDIHFRLYKASTGTNLKNM